MGMGMGMETIRSLWIRSSLGYHYSQLNSSSSSSLFSIVNSNSSATDQDAHDYTTATNRSATSRQNQFQFQVQYPIDLFHRISRQTGPLLFLLLPSFAFPRTKARKLFPTSYLDGLRGVAALCVATYHYGTCYTSSSKMGYGLDRGEQGRTDWFLLLPIIRIVHAGRFMVVLFFIISGYVLSYRSLKLARLGKHAELLDSLASSVFRRWLRLHLPVVVSTLLAFVLGRWNLWTHMPKGWEHDAKGSYMHGHPVPFPHLEGSFFHQLGDWYLDALKITDPFRFARSPETSTTSRYNIGVLWTIPLEWMGSMLVFAIVLGICKTKTWVKISVLCLLIYRSHQSTLWVLATFLSGILLAELSFLYSRPIDPPSSTSPPLDPLDNDEKLGGNTQKRRWRSISYKAFFIFLFVLGIYIGSHPREGWNQTTGYRWLFNHLPSAYWENKNERASFWPCAGAFLVVFSLEMAPFIQSIFTTSFAQYLGEISFSLYVVHVQVNYTLGSWLVPKCMDLTGGWSNGTLGFVGGMALALLVLAPVTFWVADVFSRLVDEKSVKFARWVCIRAFRV